MFHNCATVVTHKETLHGPDREPSPRIGAVPLRRLHPPPVVIDVVASALRCLGFCSRGSSAQLMMPPRVRWLKELLAESAARRPAVVPAP